MTDAHDYPTEVNRWDVFEIALQGPDDGNPFTEQRLQGIFTGKNESVVTEGFYDGNGCYKIRFMPSFPGRYSFILKGSFLESTLSGRFIVNEASEGNHGPVRTADTYHFTYEDGEAFHPIGTVCHGWHLKYDGDITATEKMFDEAGFNKVRFCIFPKHGPYNLDDPQLFPYEGTAMNPRMVKQENANEFNGDNEGNSFNKTRFNPAYFAHLENCIKDLAAKGMEADLILFHPYDRWGFSCMSEAENSLYLSYVINRLAPYHNIWWSLADSWDKMKNFSIQDWEHYADLLVRKDPYHHLRSISNAKHLYDASRPWITHASIQTVDPYKGAELTNEYRTRYQKPIVLDGLGAEGDMACPWNSIDPHEMTRRFWETALRGGYPCHSESYISDLDHIWSQNGTELKGESWKRAAFLRNILDEVPSTGLAPLSNGSGWIAAVPENEAGEDVYSLILYYYGYTRPSYQDIFMDEATDYVVEVIDTYEMTIKRIGIQHGHFRLALPKVPYIAVRLRKAIGEDYNWQEPVQEAEEVETAAPEEGTTEEVSALTQTVELPITEAAEEAEAEEAPAQETEVSEAPAEAEEAEHFEPEPEDGPEEAEETEDTEETEEKEAPLEVPLFADKQAVQEETEAEPEESEENAPEAEEETDAEPVTASDESDFEPIKSELMGDDEDVDLDFSSIPAFLSDDVKEEKILDTNTVKMPKHARQETGPADEEDDELPEIITGTVDLRDEEASSAHLDETLSIPPINADHSSQEDPKN